MIKTQLNLLDTLWKANKAEFVVLTGKLRTGKSHLIRSFLKGRPALYLQGEMLPSGELLRQYRQAFQRFVQGAVPALPRELKERFSSMEDEFGWQALLEGITEIARLKRIVIVLDEFQHMAAASPPLARLIGRTWERAWKGTRIFLVLSSSDVEFMRDHTQGFKATFHGRVTRDIVLDEPGFYDALPQLRLYRDVDRVGVYSILGGVPLYLRSFSEKLDVLDNIRSRILSPGSFLFEEPRRILLEELGQPRNFVGILSALARGAGRVRTIVEQTGLDKGMVSKYLDVLQERGLVERELPLLERAAGSRKGLYRVKSNLLRFYLRFIMPNRDLVELNRLDELINRLIVPGLDSYIDEHVRFIFQEHLGRLGREGKLGWKFNQIGSWWDRGHFLDVLATDGRGKYLLGACSWLNEERGEEMLQRVLDASDALKLRDAVRIVPVLFSRGGFRMEVRRHVRERGLLLFELRDLVRDKI